MIIRAFFTPGSNCLWTDAGLLLLRLWLGLTMCLNHGLDKLMNWGKYSEMFPSVFGAGSAGSLALAVFAEFLCSALLVAGLLGRFAALMLAITMGVAFRIGHQMKLSGAGSGELAFIYLAAFIALLIAGPGRFSADARIFGKRRA